MILTMLALAQAAQADPWADFRPVQPPPGFVLERPGWEIIGQTNTGSVWSVHRASVTRYAQYMQIWVQIDHSGDRTTAARMTRGMILFQCEPRRYHWESVQSFDANGRGIGRPGGTAMEGVPPDTLVESAWRIACRRPS